MSPLLAEFLMFILLMICVFIRVEVVAEARRREIVRAGRVAEKLAEAGLDWRQAYVKFDEGPSINGQLLDLRKWTHEQFYPQGASKE